MDNHPHLTGTALTLYGLSSFMRTVNSQFSKWYNKQNNRRGQVIMDRFKSPVVQNDKALLNVMTYGDLNPVRANIIKNPDEYRWSSYRYYAFGESDSLITPAPSYLGLANTNERRQQIYREMIRVIIERDKLIKKDYSKILFIGDPDWVERKYALIKKIKEEKHFAYLIRQRIFFKSLSP